MSTTVKLYDYNPNWEVQFTKEKRRILNALGDHVLGIEHIGSTSIQGLKAKPVIDILVGVCDLAELPQFVQPLLEIDFEYVPKPEWKDRAFFRRGLWRQGTCHLHICEIGSNEWKEKLLFRDYLRLHPEAAAEYASLKERLASKYEFDRSTYTKSKEPFIQTIIEKAKVEFQNKSAYRRHMHFSVDHGL